MLLGKQSGCNALSLLFRFAFNHFSWECICAAFWEAENIYQALCCLFSDPKKATCHFPESLPNLGVAVFNICCNCVNMSAEQALLGCADRSEFKITTVIIFHRLLVDGKFRLVCEFACSEIGQRSRWLWKKKTKNKRAGSQTPVLLIRLSPFQ